MGFYSLPFQREPFQKEGGEDDTVNEIGHKISNESVSEMLNLRCGKGFRSATLMGLLNKGF